MRVGLISDTHGLLRAEVLEAFQGVDRIFHAGDVGSDACLIELEALAPVTAVWGNADGPALRRRLPETAQVEWQGRRIVVVHGHQFGDPEPAALRAAYPDAEVIAFGHTHRAVVDERDGRLVVNPGAAGPARRGERPTVALLLLGPARASARILTL